MSKSIRSIVAALAVLVLLLAGCGKATTPTTAPPTTAPPTTTRPPATTAAPTTVAPATTAPATTRPAATTAPPATTAPATTVPSDQVTVTMTKLDGTTMQKALRKPKYGGTINYLSSEPQYFDDWFGGRHAANTMYLTSDVLMEHDYSLGPGGTGERSYTFGWTQPPSDQARPTSGGLIKKLVFLDPSTIEITIPKARYALNPSSEAARLANGREVTADDVVYSLIRHYSSPKSIGWLAYRGDIVFDETKATGPNTAIIKFNGLKGINRSWLQSMSNVPIIPREVGVKWTPNEDWKNQVGSGPFILTDYVKSNSAAFVRNPDFWQKDPFFPENQLPYADKVNLFFIPDRSTQQAALRTAKLDMLHLLLIDEFKSLQKTNPELKYTETPAGPYAIFFRVDKPDKPWNDKRVRHALSMAIDRQMFKDQYFSGFAKIIDEPSYDVPEYSQLYMPISSLPANIRELYDYKPDKAKQLLAEAGYPNGFKTTVLSNQTNVDWLQIVQNQWAQIGVDITLDLKEPGAATAATRGRTYTDLIASSLSLGFPFQMYNVAKGADNNLAMVDDPKVNDTFAQVAAAWPDQVKQTPILQAAIPYILEQRWWVSIVAPSSFSMWWPWLPNYYGEKQINTASGHPAVKYLWVDQDIKKAMGR